MPFLFEDALATPRKIGLSGSIFIIIINNDYNHFLNIKLSR
jgi:hypothetical protein